MAATDPPDGPAWDGPGPIPCGGVEDHETLMECLRVFAKGYGLQITENPNVVMKNANITLTLQKPQLDHLFGMNQMFAIKCDRANPQQANGLYHNIVGIEKLLQFLIHLMKPQQTWGEPVGGPVPENDDFNHMQQEVLPVVEEWANKPEVDFRVWNEGPFVIATPIRRYRAWNVVRPPDERGKLIVITPHGGTGTKVGYRGQLFPFKDAGELRLLLADMTTRNPMTLVDIFGVHPDGLGCTAHLETWPIQAIRQLHDRLVFLESTL